MARWEFVKWHGLENDFVVVDERGREAFPVAHVPAVCGRHRGVGADGVLVIGAPTVPGPDVQMRVYNADGSEAEMCGNGIRCVVRHLRRDGTLAVQTGAGILRCLVLPGGDVEVEMGTARIEGQADEPTVAPSRTLPATRVRMGNPHLVTFEPVEPAERAILGPWLERSVEGGTNVEFARSAARGRAIELEVWERGVGFTRACGTGACATVAAACATGRAPFDEVVQVTLPGGTLSITVPRGPGQVRMRGPAVRVFEGTLELV